MEFSVWVGCVRRGIRGVMPFWAMFTRPHGGYWHWYLVELAVPGLYLWAAVAPGDIREKERAWEDRVWQRRQVS